MGEFDKEQAIADIAENLGISKEYVNFDENKKIYIIKDNNNLKKIHIKNFNYKLYERYNLFFTKCIFECEIKDTRGLSSDIENGIFFLKCEFENKILFFNLYFKNISFILCNFKNNTTFQACTFKTFCNFESSVFENFVSFDKSMFLDKVSFYNTHFHKVPNFSQAIFNGNLNAINANLNFTFDNLEEKIEQEYEEFNKNKKEEDQKSLDKFANDFRDSFRTFKSALIKDNNALDASNFHKYELYCKEIELKNKKGKTFKDVVDRWQLIFYCKLCDHHTDILQSLNSLILVIGIFVISSVAMVFSFNYSLGYKPILEHWYFSLDFYNHHINSIIQDNYLFVATVNLVMLFGYLILVGFALCLKYMREFFIIISYVITLLVLAISPKILIPAMGIFTDKRAMLDPLSVFGGIYTIIFGFVAFSFIKTIRKNSIVPS
ncbi:pentapeptide repeat-containing protein [Campylobacter jejuni]|uniref:pentapeptide repeat-containing protein n=1 Tax=Campylobacter jejuni TaxID=197 RepID=UPI001277D1A7|nr:pentapeptide repeat-containing protein [Campylobacter jejuni]EAI8427030.1 pentapeptide repeat-containing protein [Campylobacter jejuni]EAM0128927.1 pentapeptide repeat-containing protein [Campylobacter jejuni]EDK4440267.1 pentapeptide repeat-containing protein [Campylobacter jejuni]EIU4090296.1 pentapeptide repeat-containing protein [Campylobacter jejuni]EJK3645721.1 pentapeptide repeat-containing protein [Campylobacter jejuni]